MRRSASAKHQVGWGRSWSWSWRLAVVCAIVVLAGRGVANHAAQQPLPDPIQPGTFTLTLKSGGYDREAMIHIPRSYRAERKPPLVLAFHGAGGDGPGMLRRNGWIDKSEREGFVVVGPTGLASMPSLPANFLTNPRVWNSGQLRPLSPRARIDDVAFVRTLLDSLKTMVPHDDRRIYVTGHSNGAGMTFLLGAKLPERFLALAPVAGMMAVSNPMPSRPLPTLYIIGTKDPLQPLEGGPVKLPWGDRVNPPVSKYLTDWAQAIGCQLEAKTLSEHDGLKTVEYPSKSSGGSALRVIYIEGQGHGWPGARDAGLPASTIGPSVNSLKATDAIWSFFEEVGGRTSLK